MASKSKINELTTDIAGSFFMELIGDHMDIFICIVNYLLKSQGKCRVTLGPLKKRGEHIDTKDTTNYVFPRGKSMDDVHWVFRSGDDKEHNPYKLNMQLDGSQQFCQSHSLKMAYNYCLGQYPAKTTPLNAYLELLDFWQLLIDELDNAPCGAVDQITEEILENVFELQKDQNEDMTVVNAIRRKFPHDLQSILNLLKTDYAKQTCPWWSDKLVQ